MLMPSIFGESLLDDYFDMPRFHFPELAYTGHSAGELMKADVKEKDNAYEVSLTVPGIKKDDIEIELKEGYLTVSASTTHENDQKEENGKYIRRERYSGSASRSFYVGDQVNEEDIKARYVDGILTLDIPKVDPKKAVEEKKLIAIEG